MRLTDHDHGRLKAIIFLFWSIVKIDQSWSVTSLIKITNYSQCNLYIIITNILKQKNLNLYLSKEESQDSNILKTLKMEMGLEKC